MRKLLLATIALCSFMSFAKAQDITGAGSTFAAPIYTKWGEAAASTGLKLNYQAIGSGAGINQINNRTVDFGASDMPVASDKLKQHNLFQFPTAIGGVVIIVNIPGIETNTLKLTGELIADIYLGKINKWNDPRLVELNSSLTNVKLPIAPVYRADGSGTTFVFTDYLMKVSNDWKTVGSATSVSWRAGTGAKGNDGIAATVRMAKGGIGYVESAYAETNHLTTALIKNHDGNFVKPDMTTFQASASNADWSKVENFAINLNDQPGANSWPIESATFVLIPTNQPNKNEDVKKFFDWAFKQGDNIAINLKYIPLPDTVKTNIEKAW